MAAVSAYICLKSKGIPKCIAHTIIIHAFASEEILLEIIDSGTYISLDQAKILIRECTDVRSAMIDAVIAGQINIIKAFDITSLRGFEQLLMKKAAIYGHLDIMRYFISINLHKDLELCFIIGTAAVEGHLPIVKYLCPLVKNLRRSFILEIVLSALRKDVIDYLSEKN